MPKIDVSKPIRAVHDEVNEALDDFAATYRARPGIFGMVPSSLFRDRRHHLFQRTPR
ncbi:MAG: hypothetical protein QNJ44_17285 [Rhodobacter sp.]|nr:hypothetical protein [Rhodobacter sp.]